MAWCDISGNEGQGNINDYDVPATILKGLTNNAADTRTWNTRANANVSKTEMVHYLLKNGDNVVDKDEADWLNITDETFDQVAIAGGSDPADAPTISRTDIFAYVTENHIAHFKDIFGFIC